MPIQMMIKIKAGTIRNLRKMIKRGGMKRVRLFFSRGLIRRVPPIRPDIAPLAPIRGIVELGSVAMWVRVATRPQRR